MRGLFAQRFGFVAGMFSGLRRFQPFLRVVGFGRCVCDHGAWDALGAGDQINEDSGRFRQYFFGISFCIAFTFSRAGLKMPA